MNSAIFADPATCANNRVRADLRAFSDARVFSDYGVGTDADVGRSAPAARRWRWGGFRLRWELAPSSAAAFAKASLVAGCAEWFFLAVHVGRGDDANRGGGDGARDMFGGVHVDQIACSGALRRDATPVDSAPAVSLHRCAQRCRQFVCCFFHRCLADLKFMRVFLVNTI